MRKRDVKRLQVGDYIELKHNLGKGDVTRIIERKVFKNDPSGRYPMIQFTDTATKSRTWCTYVAINWWPNLALVRSKP